MQRFIVVTLVLAGLLAGCTYLGDEIPVGSTPDTYTILGSHTLGQTFVFHRAGKVAWWFFLSALLYLLPGGVLVVWLVRGGSWIERAIVAAGLSVAVNALLVYLTLLGLRLNAPVVVSFLVICGAGIVARGILGWRQGQFRLPDFRRAWRDLQRDPAPVVLLIVFGLVLGVRLYVVRDLVAPMWGDGYQHTMIAQLLVDNGGLFDSWEPYAPLTTFTYHFGFHANVALFHWLSGDAVIHAVIWVGQILNALAVLCLYPIAVKASGGQPWAGVGAVLVAGLLLPMPMYYVNWGRYTQLAGQVILAAAMYLTWSFLQASRRDWRLIPVWIAVGGLTITHYRVLLFYAVFVLACLLVSWRKGTWWRSLGRMIWVGGGAFVVFVPWLVRIFPSQMASVFVYQMTTPAQKATTFDVQYNAIGDLTLFMAPWAWLLLAVALALGLWRRQRGVLLVALWWFVLLVITNPRWVSLPGTGAISNFALFIASYIPAGILVGNVLGWLMSVIKGRTASTALASLCVILVGSAGGYRRLGDLHAFEHSLLTREDLKAMAWIRDNTPADARFLVNSFPAYGGALVVGSDAGWWIPLLTGRANSVPPLNYGAERGPTPDYVSQVNELTYRLQELDLDAPDTVPMLCERGITHVYIGQRQGRVNYGGPHVLSLEEMLRSSSYSLLYQQDQAAILSVACATVS